MLQLNFPQVVEGLFAKSLSIERPFRRAVDDALQKDGGGVLRAERRTAHAQSACGLLTRQSDRLEGVGSGGSMPSRNGITCPMVTIQLPEGNARARCSFRGETELSSVASLTALVAVLNFPER